MESGYKSVLGLKTMKALKAKEPSLDYTTTEIKDNIRRLKSRLGSAQTELDKKLYKSISDRLKNIDALSWKDPEASTVLSDNSELIQGLDTNLKNHFLVRIF